jgi:hypothetical protein
MRHAQRLLGCELDVLVFGDLVAFDDIRLLDFVACLRIHLAVADAVAVGCASQCKRNTTYNRRIYDAQQSNFTDISGEQ